MQIKSLGVGVVCYLLLMCASNASAEGMQCGKEGSHSKKNWEKHVASMHKKLGLSDEQEKQLKEHRERNHVQMEALYEKIKAKKEEMRAELQSESFDVDKVKEAHAQLKALKSQAEDNRLEGILYVRQILTAEQFHKFMEFKKERGRGEHQKWEKHDEN